jgi:hypothetical protein
MRYALEGINPITKPQGKEACQYDSFKHLCLSLFKSRSDLFGMVTGYFDDSGTSAHDSVVVVAGYIGSVSQWQKFGQEWRSLLSEFGVTVMHRTDLENYRGEFVGWTPETRNVFVNKAQQIIKRRTYVAIGKAVIKADFEEVFPDNLKRFYGGAYGFCAILCLARAKRWFDKTNLKDPIDWVFEVGTEGSGQISHLLNSLYTDVQMRTDFRLSRWSFADKDVVPLQAADVIAYETFKHATNQLVTQPRRKVRISLQHLVRSQDDEHLEYWSKEDLEAYLKDPIAQGLIKDLTDHNF